MTRRDAAPKAPPPAGPILGSSGGVRYHGLDALRAFAMLLGIALHAALSFMDVPYVVVDSGANPAFGTAVDVIHVFRMPAFFVMSGFFTALLLSRRGLGGMVVHRARRIAIPLAISCVTIIPLTWTAFAVAGFVGAVAPAESKPTDPAASVWAAAFAGDTEALAQHLDTGAKIDSIDPRLATTPLGWAAIGGRPAAARLLIERGAEPSQRYGDDNTALHSAAFFGRAEVVRVLLEAGADPSATNVHGERPIESSVHDRGTTQWIAGYVGVKIDFDAVAAGRNELRPLLHAAIESGDASAPVRDSSDGSPARSAAMGFLFDVPIFMHLWFLWHLCWFVAIYAGFAAVARRLPGLSLPPALVATPLCLAVLIPLTAMTQALQAELGPDTSAGIVPMPHVLLHYAVYFFFGVALHAVPGAVDRLGRTWWAYLAVAVGSGVVALAAHERSAWLASSVGDPMLALLSPVAQSVFAWATILGLIGAFRVVIPREIPWVRYVSDSAYWLYLAHFPVVILAQVLIRDIPAPGLLKFTTLVFTLTAVLIVIYQWFVRYTIIGRMLNGPRTRPRATPHAVHAASPGGTSPGATS